jgi:dipeptidyl aminopeptidase/acylaminoacyl peptidase
MPPVRPQATTLITLTLVTLVTLIATAPLLTAGAAAQTQTPVPARRFQPDDLLRLQRVGAVAWSPDGRFATIEVSKTGLRQWLDAVPTNDIMLLDADERVLRPISSSADAYVGFFNAVWSRDGSRVAFLSVSPDAAIRVWVWTRDVARATVVPALDVTVGIADPPLVWLDERRLAVLAWEPGATRRGNIPFGILRGRNAADGWKRAFEGVDAAVAVQQSGVSPSPSAAGEGAAGKGVAVDNTVDDPASQVVVIDTVTGEAKTLTRGRVHRISVSPDGCCVSVLRERPGVQGQPVAGIFDLATRANDVDAGYTAVNWGTEREVFDLSTGAAITPAPRFPPAPSAPRAQPVPPRADMRLLSATPTGSAALFIADGDDGSHLWLAGGGDRPLSSLHEVWRANEWMRGVQLGRAESFSYTSTGGARLAAWLLLPPDHQPGTRLPVITIVYPGRTYTASTTPMSLSPYRVDFAHPQLFAALGYAVLLPSMPEAKDPADSHLLAPLLSGVMPAVDAAIASGVADPDRLAVMGHSAGGFATLGLIVQTTRFRSAIASASYSNLISLYGTFYGQYRHGDVGRPEAAQVLRMLQVERGAMGMGAPPWAAPDRYIDRSAVLRAHKVETPLLLVHGELDFVPIQQAEEFFTALLRQDKRAALIRYHGEGHVLNSRANILDLWQRLAAWLAETLGPRDSSRGPGPN